MGTHAIEIEVASGRGLLSLAKTVERSAGISVRLAMGTRRVIPGSKTDPLGKGRTGRVWDLVWPMFQALCSFFEILMKGMKEAYSSQVSLINVQTCES